MFTKVGWRLLIAVIALSPREGSAQQQSAPIPLSPGNIVTVLQRAGLAVDLAHVQMPAGLTAMSSQPSLQIAGAELLRDGRVRVRLSCESLGVCQPFVIDIAGSSYGNGLKTLASLHPGTPSFQQGKAPNPAMLRCGQQAQMFLEDERMRIAIPVVAIDSGPVGAEVRVASLDRKQTYRAFVVSTAEVRGHLP